MTPRERPFRAAYLLPRYWPTWLGLGLLRACTWLPLAWTRAFGRGLGRLLGRLAGSRRRVVQVNLALCLPELDEAARARLVEAHFAAIGAGLFETAFAWFASDRRIRALGSVEGLAHLDALQARGEGALLLTGHFTTLELGARMLAVERPFHAMYRHVNNPLIDDFMYRSRQRRTRLPPLPKQDLKTLVRALRQGRAIWYAPDQTLGNQTGLFLPMFGQPSFTITATARLAQMGRARVLPFFTELEQGRYRVRFQPPLEAFPGPDEADDAARINAVIEAAARRSLPEYFWVHRRFKARPPGVPDPYR
ncbi:MAG TPA: LpxL/LpxP family Kdo(2)-lipid IV(A) lauroyl/palmitoleoyl acyltransferase [Nevskiaceae bacterium]|nr:LpxL/LpxP family Kdo(2)-lipid IV(A) lauroyl/palmitoleoyl acyltransferase [Nevskiaceae bacterium]